MPSKDELGFEFTDVDEIARLIADKTWTYYACVYGRPGFNAFAAFVEYTFFHPRFGPNSNDDFQYLIVHFGMIHALLGVPQRFEPRVNEIAIKLRLKPVLGVPVLLEAGGRLTEFPGADAARTGRANLYTIENTPGLAYETSPRLQAELAQRETMIMDTLRERGPLLAVEDAASFLWRGR